MARKVPFLVNLEPEQHDLLKEVAEKLDRSAGELIREAVDALLEKYHTNVSGITHGPVANRGTEECDKE